MIKRYKNFLCIFLSLILAVSIVSPTQVSAKGKTFQTGITLDCARRYYSVDDIKKYIHLLSGGDAPFLQLHLSDDENVGIECLYLKQTVKTARKLKNGSYQNKKTGKKFLSRAQIREILRYASKKNVMIIPEIDMPAHMNGFFTLARQAYGSKYLKQIVKSAKNYPGELDIKSKKAIKFAKEIYSEYAALFKNCKYFHMGCDEFSSASGNDVVSYINTMSKFLQKKGFTVRIWNDLLYKKNIKKVNHKLQVTYWSYDGDVQNSSLKKKRRKLRASAKELQKEGFKILNYNSYYLYFTPSKTNCNRADRDYMVQDVKENWNIRKWDQDSSKELPNNRNILGAAVSVWGEDSAGLSSKKIYQQVKPLYQAMEQKTCGK